MKWLFLLMFIFQFGCTAPIGVEVPCSECNGNGKVIYGPEHPMVKDLGYEAGEYTCPICGGEGTLIKQ